MAHSSASITTVFAPAEDGVRIDGWVSTCSECGFRTGNSLGERWASRQAWDHVAYMAKKESTPARKGGRK